MPRADSAVDSIGCPPAEPERSASFTDFEFQAQVVHCSLQGVPLPLRACDFSAVGRPERSVMQRPALQCGSSCGPLARSADTCVVGQCNVPTQEMLPSPNVASSSATQRNSGSINGDGYKREKNGVSTSFCRAWMAWFDGDDQKDRTKCPGHPPHNSPFILPCRLSTLEANATHSEGGRAPIWLPPHSFAPHSH
jgi:hypothetical protein